MKDYNNIDDDSVNNEVFGWLLVIVISITICLGVYFLTNKIN